MLAPLLGCYAVQDMALERRAVGYAGVVEVGLHIAHHACAFHDGV